LSLIAKQIEEGSGGGHPHSDNLQKYKVVKYTIKMKLNKTFKSSNSK
jgi:hypothetical protein